MKPDELINVPYCGGCMAGVCRVRREIRGPNAGRILFMCRVKEGEGSCGYRVWQDELETSANAQADERRTSCQSTLTNCDDTLPVNDDLAEGSRENDLESTVILSQTGPTSMTNCNNNGPATMTDYNDSGPAGNSNYTSLADDESPVIHNLRDLECVGVTSETTNESSRKPPKRSRYGDLKARGSSISAHPLMLSLGVNSESIKPCWMAAAIRKNLSAQLKGWWGRLVFHPRPCLMTHSPRPFTCCITSPLDSTFVVQDKIPVNSGASTIPTMNLPRIASCSKSLFTSCHNAQLSGIKPFCVSVNSPSCSEPLCDIRFQNVMSKSISEAFGQAAEHLQNELLTHLETMDVKDHEAMRQAAEATFAALDRLLFDHQDFKARANELIHCATLLANIEESMPRNNSYQKLVDQCSSERMRLDEINSFHAKAVDTMTDNKKRLKVLQEEISSTMDWIFQIEAELSSCEIEMLKMEHELDEISKNKEVLEGKFLIASKALEESQKLRQLKEAEWNAAKATYDRARMLLRG